jgi:hypothetical protein
VHTERLISTFIPALREWSSAAFALRIIEVGTAVATTAPPSANPERRKNVRRSIARPKPAVKLPAVTAVVCFLINFIV